MVSIILIPIFKTVFVVVLAATPIPSLHISARLLKSRSIQQLPFRLWIGLTIILIGSRQTVRVVERMKMANSAIVQVKSHIKDCGWTQMFESFKLVYSGYLVIAPLEIAPMTSYCPLFGHIWFSTTYES